jgi:hypothetical protein
MPCTALGAGSACPHFVNPNSSGSSRCQPGPVSCDFGLGPAFLPPPKPVFPHFRSWDVLPAPTQDRFPAIPVLARLSSPLPSPDPRVSGPGSAFLPPPKPVFPHFRSWDALPGGSQSHMLASGLMILKYFLRQVSPKWLEEMTSDTQCVLEDLLHKSLELKEVLLSTSGLGTGLDARR